MSRASITGYVELPEQDVFLSDVLGMYADRGTPRKPGYWVQLKSDTPKGITKIYTESLTEFQRRVINAAAVFNQAVIMAEYL